MSQNPAAIFQEAVNLCKDEKYDEAIQLIDTLLQYQPQHRLGLFVRGSIRVQHQQVREAMIDWESAFEGMDRQAAQRVQQQYPELVELALNHFAFETTVDPNDPLRHAAYGKAARYFDKFEQAQRHLLRAFEIDKYYWKEALLAADLHKALGDNEAAVQLLQKLQELHPDNAEIQYRSAVFHQQANSTAFALRHLEKAVSLDPTHSDARYALGTIYVQQGRSDQAITQLHAAIKVKPTAAGHCRLAEAHQQLYQFDEALHNYRLAADLEPENFKLLCDLGALALQFGDLPLGISSLKKAVAIDPKHPDVHAHLAKAALQSGDLDEATSSYQKLLDLQPDDVFALRSLASIHLTQSNPAVAIPLLTRAKNLNASDVQVWIDLARAYRLSNNAVSAKQTLREALELYPNNLALQQESMADPSSSEQNQAPTLPPMPELSFEEHYNLARAAREAGNSDEALKSFSQALALEPANPDCLEAVALLYRDKGLLAPAADFMRQSYALTLDRQDRLETFVNLLDGLIDFEQDELLDEFFQSESVVPEEILEKTSQLSGPGVQAVRKRYPEIAVKLGLQQVEAAAPTPDAAQSLTVESSEPPTDELVTEEIGIAQGTSVPEEQAPTSPAQPSIVEAEITQVPAEQTVVQANESEWNQQPMVSPLEAIAAGSTIPESPGLAEEAAAASMLDLTPEVGEIPGTQQASTESPSIGSEPTQESLFAVDFSETATAEPESLSVTEAVLPSAAEPNLVLSAEAPRESPEPQATSETENASLTRAPSLDLSDSLPVHEKSSPLPPAEPEPSTSQVVSAQPSAELAELQVALEEMQADLIGRESELSEKEGRLENQRLELVSREQSLEEKEQKLAELEKQLQSKAVQLQWETEESQQRQQQLAAKEQQLVAQQETLQTSITACSEKEAELSSREQSLAKQMESFVQREASLKALEDELQVRLSSLEKSTPVLASVVQEEPQEAPPAESAVVQAPEPTEPSPVPAAPVVTVAPVSVVPVAKVVTIPSLSPESKPEVAKIQPEPVEAKPNGTGPADLAALSLLLDKDPEYPNAVDIAWQLSKQNESDFLALFRELSRPSNADSRHSRNFALAYLHQQRPLLAVVQLQKYLQKSPTPEGYRLLADVYQRMNRQSNVEDCLRRAEALEAQG